MSWIWLYESADGAALDPAELGAAPTAEIFPSQSDAESWLGEVWPELLHAGVEKVTLKEGDRTVYGPMSLRPPD